MVLGAELLGAVLAAWAFKSAFDSVKSMGTRLRLVRECGCNAFVLGKDEFTTYVKQYGDASVYEELSFVEQAGVRLPDYVANWVKSYSGGLPALPPADDTNISPEPKVGQNNSSNLVSDEESIQVPSVYSPAADADTVIQAPIPVTDAMQQQLSRTPVKPKRKKNHRIFQHSPCKSEQLF